VHEFAMLSERHLVYGDDHHRVQEDEDEDDEDEDSTKTAGPEESVHVCGVRIVSPPAAEDKMCGGCTVYHRENVPTEETLWRLILGEGTGRGKGRTSSLRPLSVHSRAPLSAADPIERRPVQRGTRSWDSVSTRTSTQDSQRSDAPTLRACNWMEENLSNFREMPATHAPYRIQSRRLGDFTSGWAASASFSTDERMGSDGKGFPCPSGSVNLRPGKAC
jgi:hypothetical protein